MLQRKCKRKEERKKVEMEVKQKYRCRCRRSYRFNGRWAINNVTIFIFARELTCENIINNKFL